jgi:hypothetical protein
MSTTLSFTDDVASPASSDLDAARAAWRRRTLLVGGGFQVAFGAMWLARGLGSFAPLAVAAAAAGAALVGGMAAAVALRRSAPQPHGPAVRTIERRLTVATVAQLLASFALPMVIDAAAPRLTVPLVILTIGILLAWIHGEVGTPFQGAAGWALIALAAASTLLVGPAQTAVAGLTAAVILLGCAAAGFGWLRHADRAVQ